MKNNIKVCTSHDVTKEEWYSYINSFNTTFQKEFTWEYFHNKYFNVTGDKSYHSFLLSDEGKVVGGVTVIPCRYLHNGKEIIVGLAVDAFVNKEYRGAMVLFMIYRKMVPMLKEAGVISVIAVPNSNAHSYWCGVVKWKDIGRINYWMLPVKAGNIFGKKRIVGTIVNIASQLYCFTIMILSCFFSCLNDKDRRYHYSLVKDDAYAISKFNGAEYHKYSAGSFSYVYKIEDEEGVKTGYLLNAEENGRRSFRSFRKAVTAILKNDVDIVLYVGKIGFFQTIFLKVPKRFEPKLLPMTCDMIVKDENYSDMMDVKNWDFGLKDYDVR